MDLPPRNCPACGVSNLATAIYCVSCKGILPAIPVLPGVMGRVRKRSLFPSWGRVVKGILVAAVVPALFLLLPWILRHQADSVRVLEKSLKVRFSEFTRHILGV